MKLNIDYLCRQITGANNQHPVNLVENSKNPPKLDGESFYFTTPSGKTRINHPNAYGWPMQYHCSTLAVKVGVNWQPKIPKGMELRTKNGTHLIRLSDGMDLHFSAYNLLKKDFCGWARKEMAKNYKNRLITRKLDKEFKNKTKSTFVNFTDAQRAGNCVQGILDYAKRKLNLDKEDLLVAPWLTQVSAKLLNKIDPLNHLVKNSINQAYLRETTITI